MMYTKQPPCTAIYPFHSHTYELPLLTQSANWSEPPLHRAHWPPTPTLLTVADCQVGKYVCVVELHRTVAQKHRIREYLQTITQPDGPEKECSITPRMNSTLLCHCTAC